jgi:hypothetical protein
MSPVKGSRRVVLLAIALALAASTAFPVKSPAQKADDFQSIFDRAEQLSKEGQLDAAIELDETRRQNYGDDPAVVWNLGIMYAERDRHANALESWQTLRRLEPENWRVRTKLIQATRRSGSSRSETKSVRRCTRPGASPPT